MSEVLVRLIVAVPLLLLSASRTWAEMSLSPATSVTVILLPVDPGTPLPAPKWDMFYESGWVLTDSATGTEEFRVATNTAMPPGLRWTETEFPAPMVSVTMYFEVEAASEGSGLGPGDRLLVLPLRSVSPSATSWQGNFIVREIEPPAVLQVRVRMSGRDVYGRSIGRVDPSVSTFNDANRADRITRGDDERTVVTINTAPERPGLVADGHNGGRRSDARLVPLWASEAHQLTAGEAKRRRMKAPLACGVGKPIVCAKAEMLVYVRQNLTLAEGEAICRSKGWKPMHFFRRRGSGGLAWFSVLLSEGQDLCQQLDAAGRLQGVERATPLVGL